MDSHRSDDPRGLRRHKTSRPSNASIMHIGKGMEMHPSLKKLYDHSPHAVNFNEFSLYEELLLKFKFALF